MRLFLLSGRMAKEPVMVTRKIVSLPAELAKAVDDFRFENRLRSEAEAIRILLEAGLEAKRKA